MRSHIQILVHLWSPPPPPPPGESVKPTLSSERKKTPHFSTTLAGDWKTGGRHRRSGKKKRGSAPRFSSLARPSFSPARHWPATHAIFLPRTHAHPSRFHVRACVCVRRFPARGGTVLPPTSLSLSPLSFVSYTEAGRERERDTRRWRRWRRAMFIEGRKIDGAGGRREARQPFFSF